jgi:bridging integrator 3
MCAYFPVVNEHIAKRDKKVRLPSAIECAAIEIDRRRSQLLDYDAARSRLKKLIDKPSEDPTKLPRVRHTSFILVCTLLMKVWLGTTRTRRSKGGL